MAESRRDAEFTEYVTARLMSLRRVAYLLCRDWATADDLVQAAIIKLYVHWGRIRAMDRTDAYARVIVVREFLNERRTGWARRVELDGRICEVPAAYVDHDGALDVRNALATLPPRQRATLVLRFYCDFTVEQAAQALGCSPGTVKSQTARGLDALRRALGRGSSPPAAPLSAPTPAAHGPSATARQEEVSHG